ncbi:hypothetical protein BBO_08318 [Beauveria brongniartii RCEF 3172]|uniref:Tat pathway signal sequence n=1 Tax=Beauveria brongniartii RCEF 3172 TaxID=1081107 RepID=A0A166XSY3_9HYPO|nr:hypothetical protein BBO_08318 [Beauveria brongniartii RCEF 3172]
MSFFTRHSFKYQLVDEQSEAKRPAQSSPTESRRPKILSCFIAVVAFGFGALVGVFLLAPRRPLSGCATGSQQAASDVPTSDIAINVIRQTFHYNRTFGEAPDHQGTSEAWESIVPARFIPRHRADTEISKWSIHGNYYRKVDGDPDTDMSAAHMRHCFDYLRQGLMCASDTSLEPVDPKLGGVTGWGSERLCRDYQQVVAWAEDHRVSNLRGFQETPHHHRK